MSALRRVNALYVVAAVLFVVAVLVTASGTRDETGLSRSASVYDDGPGGAALLRHWLDDLHARTRAIQGDRFAVADDDGVVLVLGATEAVAPADVATLRSFVARGGTLIVATEAGAAETLLLRPYGVALTGLAQRSGDVLGAAAATGARTISLDLGRVLDTGTRGVPLARNGSGTVAAMVPDGAGRVFVVGSLAPFLSGQIGDADNGRFVLALLAAALRSGTAVAFDEYHHGAHPAPDVLAILERTWPGRALVVAGALVFVFVALTGRRLGPPLPLEHRAARSSLDHVRAFAGLVRRSGHGEIARERLRRDLRGGLARLTGMDPGAPLDRMLAAVPAERATEAREIDALLARPLRDADLIRTVRRIDHLLAPEGVDA